MNDILNLINENTFLISDHHFHHKNINKFEPIRLKVAKKLKYINTEKMMIDKWNSVVGKNDTVLYLGDFAFAYIDGYLKKLNGNKIFIYGNHDKNNLFNYAKVIKGVLVEGEETIQDRELSLFSGLIKTINGKKIMFYHYPLEYEDKYDKQKERIVKRINKGKEIYNNFNCDLLIHGHVHSNEQKDIKNHFNVSCESLNFVPIQIKELLHKIT